MMAVTLRGKNRNSSAAVEVQIHVALCYYTLLHEGISEPF